MLNVNFSSLQQLNQYYESHEYYKSQYPYEDGQFDDAKSDDGYIL